MTSKRLSWPNCAAKKNTKLITQMHEMKESQEQCCLLHESVTVKIRDNPPLFFNKCAWKYFHLETSRRHTVRYFITKITVFSFRNSFSSSTIWWGYSSKYIYWIGTFLFKFEPVSRVFNKNTDKQNRCAISLHKLKSQRIYYYYLSYFLTFDIFRHSKILKNDKNYSVCTLLNPFYFVCCLFIWTVKIICWIGT